jgi:hypothetical protein
MELKANGLEVLLGATCNGIDSKRSCGILGATGDGIDSKRLLYFRVRIYEQTLTDLMTVYGRLQTYRYAASFLFILTERCIGVG